MSWSPMPFPTSHTVKGPGKTRVDNPGKTNSHNFDNLNRNNHTTPHKQSIEPSVLTAIPVPTIMFLFFLSNVVTIARASAIDMVISSGGLTAQHFATTFAVLTFLHSICMMTAPKTMLELYNAPTGKMNTHIFKIMGTAACSFSVVALCVLLDTCDIVAATGYAQIPWLVGAVKNLLTSTYKHAEYEITDDLVVIFLSPLILYACVLGDNISFADSVARYFGYFIFMQGVSMALTPAFHTQMWGSDFEKKSKAEPILSTSIPALGLFMLQLGTMIVAVDAGYTGTQAMGFAWVWMLIASLLPLFTNNKKEGNSMPTMMWASLISAGIYGAITESSAS